MTLQENSSRHRVVLLLALLFAAPVLAALALRLAGWEPGATGNHGTLIEPPVSLAGEAELEPYRDYWVLVVNTASPCAASCAGLLDGMLRTRRALGKDADRVRILVPGADRLPRALMDAPLVRAPGSITGVLRSAGLLPTPGSVAVIDPRGFLMMRYPPGFEFSGLLEDLERLLRYSRVGEQA